MGRKQSQGSIGSTDASLGNLLLTSNALSAIDATSNISVTPNGTGSVTSNKVTLLQAGGSASSTSTGSLRVTGGVGVSENVNIGGTLNVTNGINSTAIGGTTTATVTDLYSSGLTTLNESTEVTPQKTGATGTVIHNFNESNSWVHASIAANFTVNLTNVPTTNNRSITINLYLVQGNTPYFANAFQIDGVAQTINWSGYAAPTPQANAYELQSFQLVRSGSAWTVIGTLTTFGDSIVRDDLRAYYDAGIAASAPTGGNGTTWVDISGSSYSLGNVSLSGTTFSYSTATGTGSVVNSTTAINVNSGGIPVTLTNFSKQRGTFEFWARPTSYSGGAGLFINRSDSTANDVNWFWIGGWNNGTDGYYRIGDVPLVSCCSNDISYAYNTLFPVNTWTQGTFVWDFTVGSNSGYLRIYRNGTLATSRTVSNGISVNNVSSIGRFFNGHENSTNTLWLGHCAIIRHYSVPLTQAQISRNFNANRARFGI